MLSIMRFEAFNKFGIVEFHQCLEYFIIWDRLYYKKNQKILLIYVDG